MLKWNIAIVGLGWPFHPMFVINVTLGLREAHPSLITYQKLRNAFVAAILYIFSGVFFRSLQTDDFLGN